jgi:hypothetical protein
MTPLGDATCRASVTNPPHDGQSRTISGQVWRHDGKRGPRALAYASK